MTRPWPRVRESGGGGGLYSADLRSRTFHQGDTLTLPAGSGVLAMAGTGEVIHSGAFIDVTEGVEIPSGSKLTPGHRYLAGEDTSAVISVRSGAMYLGLQGSYGYEPGGGDPMPFVDVAQGDWFQSAVEYVYGNGLFSGMSADRFSPGTTMNRAMLVTVFYRLAGSPEGELNAADASFTDVADGSWYAPFVRWGYVQGVTAGMGDGSFAPEQSVTRQQILVMLHSFARQYLKLTPTGTADLSIYGDGGQVAGWARDAVSWAVSAGADRSVG
ncbi:MAG: S-layer homology domain-containing protein [Lawsonibacter sp.]